MPPVWLFFMVLGQLRGMRTRRDWNLSPVRAPHGRGARASTAARASARAHEPLYVAHAFSEGSDFLASGECLPETARVIGLSGGSTPAVSPFADFQLQDDSYWEWYRAMQSSQMP